MVRSTHDILVTIDPLRAEQAVSGWPPPPRGADWQAARPRVSLSGIGAKAEEVRVLFRQLEYFVAVFCPERHSLPLKCYVYATCVIAKRELNVT